MEMMELVIVEEFRLWRVEDAMIYFMTWS